MQAMAWHDGGLLLGLQWTWWAFWIAVFLALVTAFWRLFGSGTRRPLSRRPPRP